MNVEYFNKIMFKILFRLIFLTEAYTLSERKQYQYPFCHFSTKRNIFSRGLDKDIILTLFFCTYGDKIDILCTVS